MGDRVSAVGIESSGAALGDWSIGDRGVGRWEIGVLEDWCIRDRDIGRSGIGGSVIMVSGID